MTVAAVLILKNEAAMIRPCIESLRGVDEIVAMVDIKSTDATADILREMSADYPITLGFREWHDDFSRARNEALGAVTSDWCLNIDADETLCPDGVALVRQAIARTQRNALQVRMQWNHGTHHHFFPRLIRRGVRYKGRAHEFPEAGPADPSGVVIFCGRSPAHETDPQRSVRILSKAYAENPNDPRTLYYLAREHWYRKEYHIALPLFQQCSKLSRFAAERADARLYSARILWGLRRGEEARDECLRALAANANSKEALLLMAEMSFPKNAEAWKRFADVATNEDVLFVRGVG